MTLRGSGLSRRGALAATAVAAGSFQAWAAPQSLEPRSVMLLSVRRAALGDLPVIVDLLTQDAEQRRSRVPLLWPVAADAKARIEGAVRSGLDDAKAAAGELWLLAEASGRAVGIAHAMILPVPPIYGPTADEG